MSLLPHEYQMTEPSERFVLFDSGVEDINRMFIYASNGGIDMLANSSQWFGDDGTFKVWPQIFSHILYIHIQFMPWSAMKFFFTFPLLWSKTEIAYEQFFTIHECSQNLKGVGNQTRRKVQFILTTY